MSTAAARLALLLTLLAAPLAGGEPRADPTADAPRWTLTHAEGRGRLRDPAARITHPGLRPGIACASGAELTTLAAARCELRGPAGELWRLGERARWHPRAAGDSADLFAGTALLHLPGDRALTLRTAKTAVRLSPGTWLLTAVENGGLKIVALEHGAARILPPTTPPADTEAEAAAEQPRVPLRAGEIIFAPPDGAPFGPLITIYLTELLATSRLVGRFPTPLPHMDRLVAHGEAQRERLAGATDIHVGGAREDGAFELLRRKPPEGAAVAPAAPLKTTRPD
jgi:hypothetical protein